MFNCKNVESSELIDIAYATDDEIYALLSQELSVAIVLREDVDIDSEDLTPAEKLYFEIEIAVLGNILTYAVDDDDSLDFVVLTICHPAEAELLRRLILSEIYVAIVTNGFAVSKSCRDQMYDIVAKHL